MSYHIMHLYGTIFQGHCTKATIDLGLSVDVTEIYFIGEISAVTVGKIIRMLGRNIELPEYVAETGFQKALQVNVYGQINFVVQSGLTLIFQKY